MADSFFKKENNKKKAVLKKQKALRKLERKTNNLKGKGFQSMIIYVDEHGHFTSMASESRTVKESHQKILPKEPKIRSAPGKN
ncbi:MULTISPECIES: hypothetical protein [Flavobacterium]|uniref:Uncharacterized protein n=1 Tax=Flavobacterium endoglycinae TaxID=2816357 RepID=A0ABX7QBM1_9FLAO|nr:MULTISPECIES: hypothetical protein [Flavobacterium]QSW88445.1 hypothetical protein J0383_19595 [Flavobacterium endoglycinae]